MKYGFLLAMGLALSLPVQAKDAREVFDCMKSNIPQTLRIQEIQLDATDRSGGVRSLRGKVYAKREEGLVRVMLRVAEPVNVAGAAYLVRETGQREDDMYVFLPAVNRVRHVTGNFANGSLLGTDFSYVEVKLIQNAFTGAAGTLEAPEKIDGRATDVVSLKPAGDKAPYSQVKIWVDQKTCVALKAEFFNGGTAVKRLTTAPAGLKQSGKLWYVSDMEMRDLKEGTFTTLHITGVTSDADLGGKPFDPNSFHLGR
ncbi:outer membrane lipoprotein-sorting protein [Solimonas sp. K1W22B-7]|uniref:outer membrane lipoprotein-sorting protein n=1 Tax=Solimonas sp. K1W22B-7 TaxID=2303331 RepID=UPI000E334290|nr:outer membrane lipoprotein-sorting protein [Solimonas sp. K1W22B-7]AXQ30185.1 outer membrane lipoprotein-sorting protein [Solimonas sp. K1W22B-7]